MEGSLSPSVVPMRPPSERVPARTELNPNPADEEPEDSDDEEDDDEAVESSRRFG